MTRLPRGTWRALLARPALWPTAVRQGLRLARPGWWRRPPFVPRPEDDVVAFRLETQYGAARPDPADLVAYLEWCRDQERALRRWRRRSRR